MIHTHNFYWSGSHSHTANFYYGNAYEDSSNNLDNWYIPRTWTTQNYVEHTYQRKNNVTSTTITINGTTGSMSRSDTGTPSTANTADSTAFTSGAGSSHSHSMSHTHSVTASGSVSVSTNPTFTGSSVISGGASGDTGSTGSGTSFSIMPPYIIKYCWERTA